MLPRIRIKISQIPAWLVLALSLAGSIPGIEAAEAGKPTADEYLTKAREAFQRAQIEEALGWADKATKAAPEDPRTHFARGAIHQTVRNHVQAIDAFSEVIRLQPRAVDAYHKRGEEHFKLGQIEKSVADFNREVDLKPSREPHHWQRGLAFYYAGRHADGRNQFELHQTVNSADVENAVWHFLCVARDKDLDTAREKLIHIEGDRRVPMMQVYHLFAGKGTADDVMTAVHEGAPPPQELRQRQFFAHLYLALYYDVHGDLKTARLHIDKATGEFAQKHYMGDVARVHKQAMEKMEENAGKKKQPAGPTEDQP